jgi:hypothetical protein
MNTYINSASLSAFVLVLLLFISLYEYVLFLFMFSTLLPLFPQISDQASIIFEDTSRQDKVAINFDIPSDPLTLAAYIEDCRMKLWDNAFPTFFRGQEAFNKTLEFVGFNGTDLIVRIVLSLTTSFLIFGIVFCFFTSHLFHLQCL